jgi:UDP-N-acetylmuramoyl-L-alanyl-D-glutamate--2,6-diaminopimelate ligase
VSSQPGSTARLRAVGITEVTDAGGGLTFTLAESAPHGGIVSDGAPDAVQSASVSTALVGRFNVDNLLIVAACLRALGHPLPAVAQALGVLKPVPGRMERVVLRDDAPSAAPAVSEVPQPALPMPVVLPEVIVDYAHTPDALAKALAALAPRARARGGRLWCVFGCGGGRDASKRAPMGAAAAAGAQCVVVTSDNPRGEAPGAIIDQVLQGVPRGLPAGAVRAIEDRRTAIAEAILQAGPQDVVLVAGKGHETTQEIDGRKLPFSDAEEAAAALHRRLRAEGPTAAAAVEALP